MENGEKQIPIIRTQEGEHTILGTYRIHIEGRDSSEDQNVLIIAAPDQEIPFRAIDPKTEDNVPLSVTRIVDVYRNILQQEAPAKYLKRTDPYWTIRGRKKKAKERKSIPIETPIQH